MKYVKAKSPYWWRHQGPKTFDCSGFTYWVLYQVGLVAKGTRTNSGGYGSRYPKTTTPKMGDLVVFAKAGAINHIGIVLGEGTKFIGANGGGDQTFGDNPRAHVKIANWTRGKSRTASFRSLDDLIAQHRDITE